MKYFIFERKRKRNHVNPMFKINHDKFKYFIFKFPKIDINLNKKEVKKVVNK